MSVDKGGERGEQGLPEGDWSRIESGRAQRDVSSREYDETLDPWLEFEQAARPLPPAYGSHRPKHLELTEAQREDLEAVYGRPIEELLALRENDPRNIHHRDEHGTTGQPDAEQPETDEAAPAEDDGPRRSSTASREGVDLGEIADGLRTGRLTALQPADRVEAYQQDRRDPDGNGRIDSESSEADSREQQDDGAYLTEVRRVHILDGDGTGGGGHRYGTGVPMKSEFPAGWDDDKIVSEVRDVARNPDGPAEVQDDGRLIVRGVRDGVEIRVVMEPDGAIVTGHPLRGLGVVRNDQYGNPRTLD